MQEKGTRAENKPGYFSFQEATTLTLPIFKEDLSSINNLGNQTSLRVVRET